MRGASIRRRGLCVLSLGTLSLAMACGREFPSSVPASVTIEPIGWPDTLTETDVASLRVRVRVAGGADVAGAPLVWRSSDATTLELAPTTATDTSSAGRLAAQLGVVASARRVGVVDVAVTTADGGPLAHAALQRTVVIAERWTSVSSGYSHSCATTIRNDAYCWGGGLRLLGNGSSAGSVVPSKVVGGLAFRSVSGGWEQSCGALLDALLWCWGFNPLGGVGNGSTLDQLAPVPVALGPKFKSFTVGFGFTCGISDIDTAVCWGDDGAGQLGSTDAADACGAARTRCSTVPVVVRLPGGQPLRALAIAPAEIHTCAVALDHTAWCWGDNTLGTLGSTVARSDVPVAVAGTVSFAAISASRYQSCGLAVDGRAWCWGTNLFGELGSDASPDVCDGLPCARAPTAVAGSRVFTAISVRGRTACAVATDSLPYCWGLGDHGQLGASAPDVCSGRPCAKAPTPVTPSFKAVSISVGESHVCALAASGAAYCWGQNDDGRLGTGTTGDTPRPTRVADPR